MKSESAGPGGVPVLAAASHWRETVDFGDGSTRPGAEEDFDAAVTAALCIEL